MTISETVSERRLSPLARIGFIGALGAVLAAGTAWAGSEGLNNLCDTRDQFAPGGHASPAALCEGNDAFRAGVAETAGDFANGTPVIDLGPLLDYDPIFDPRGER